MKEIKNTKTIEEVIAYEASDGKRFYDKAESEKYEKSAKCAVNNAFNDLVVHTGCELDFGGDWLGCEDHLVYRVHIKNAEDLKIANMYMMMRNCYETNVFPTSYIGKDVLVLSSTYDEWDYCIGTYDEVVEMFTKGINKLFGIEKKEEK